MPQIIDVPGQGQVEFPDGMSDEQIVAAIQRNSKPAGGPAPKGLSTLDKIKFGMMDPINGGAQLLTNALPKGLVDAGNRANNWLADKTGLVARLPEGGVDQQVREQQAEYDARRAAGGESGFDGYRALGGFAATLPLALATGGAGASVGLAGRVGIGAAQGGAASALAPVASESDYWSEKGKQVATGAALGGALAPALGAVARVISPNATRNTNLQLLKDEGVRPTIGQALGGRWNAAEEKLQSLPIVGDAISLARGRSLEQFNRAAVNRASGKVGTKVEQVGHEGVREAGDAISDAYGEALSKISGVQLDGQFNNGLMQLRSLSQGLTTEMRNKFDRAVDQVLLRKVSRNGSILPDDYKAIDSELGNLASRYGKSSVASEQELGDAMKELRSMLQHQMVRSNPQVAAELKAADTGWANLVRVEGAAKAGKNAEGVFTPAQLNQAIQGADQSVRKRAVARGSALMQDLGNAGQSVLGNKVPNSGTWDRAAYGVGALASGAISPVIPGALIGGGLAYMPLSQRILLAAASSRPAAAKPTADALRKATPVLIPGLSQLPSY